MTDPFVPRGDPAEENVLVESEAIWTDLGGYRAVGSLERRRISAGVAAVVAELHERRRELRRSGVSAQSFTSEQPADNFQLQRGLYAMRAGGLLGVGLGEGRPEAIPEVTEDLPAVVLGEALGFAGIATVALLLLLLGLRGVTLARAAGRSASSMVVLGLSSALALQAIVALGSTVGLFPFTGLTFPFMSRSGTSLLATFAAVGGIVVLVARNRPVGARANHQRHRRPTSWVLRGGGIPAAFCIVLLATAVLQLTGRTTLPGSLLEKLPGEDAAVAHATDQWSASSYRVAPGPIVDRHGYVLARSDAPESPRSYPDRPLSQSLGQTLASLQLGFNRELTAVGDGDAPQGPTLVTTIDSDLQRAVHRAFDEGVAAAGLPGGRSLRGAAVALDARTGAILALESRPSFSLLELEDRDFWAAAEARDRRAGFPYRYLNRAVNGYYPPGSIYKTITAAEALESGHRLYARDFDYRDGPQGPRRPDGLLHQGRWHQLDLGIGPPITDGNHPELKNWRFSINDAFKWSCNIVFAQLGVELGPAGVLRAGRRFGFERRIDIPGLGDSLSTLDDGWRKPLARRPLAQSPGALARTSFGQGQVRTTPLHMALVPAAIANGGDMMQPHIVAGWKDAGGRWIRRTEPQTMLRTGLSERTITDLQTMMHNSATDGWASAARVTPDNTHPGIGGKTGSAEWTENQDAPHSWYFGFYPTEEPRVSVALVVERGGLGPTVAARVAKRIFSSSALERYVQGVSE